MFNEDSSAKKALRILRYLIEQSGRFSVRDISRDLHIPKSTVHRLLRDLHDVGFVHVTAENHFSLSIEMYRLATLVLQKLDYLDVVHQVVKETAEETGESALFGQYNRTHRQMMVAIMEESEKPLRYVVNVGVLQSVFQGASGKGILAWLPDEEMNLIVQDAVKAGVEINIGALNQELAAIRERGYAITYGERIPGAVGISAPVFGTDNEVLGDLLVTIPEFRFDHHMEESVSKLIVRQAEKLSWLLRGVKV